MNVQLWERLRDWVLLFVLLTLSVVTLLARNEPVVRLLRARALEVTGQVERYFAWAGSFVRALEENDRLRAENIRLSSEVARSREARQENAILRRMLGLVDTLDVPVRPVHILSKDSQRRRLLIDAGSAEGVTEDMAVIDTRGILGRTELVSTHYAEVMTYLDTDFRVPARIQPLRVDGILRWEGNDPDRLLLEFVVKTEPVQKGQTVVTSGYSGIFPAGYPIGVIDSVAARPGRNELLIYVRPFARLDDATFAFVVMQKPQPERTLPRPLVTGTSSSAR
ncbi:MAG: rod shape-determining protein MreC [Rhodothermaceae bacterium]|nr:MAG: rod shape-determining protein MreC [Bacteroidota bacterium]GIV61351.1 MAG: rod shape-determining protein MreC [Rhodothermaceae bacterium]